MCNARTGMFGSVPRLSGRLQTRITQMITLRKHITALLAETIIGRLFKFGRVAPRALIAALLIALAIAACAAREADESMVNTDAVTPGASAAVNEKEEAPDASSGPALRGADGEELMPPGSHVAAASRDEDTWFLVTDVNAEREYAVYVDTSTIQTIDSEVYSWSRLVFNADQKDSDGLVYREVIISSAIDCGKRTFSYKSSKFYDSLGRMVFMENIATNMSKIPENSVSGHIADFVCGYDTSGAKKAAPAPVKPQQKSK